MFTPSLTAMLRRHDVGLPALLRAMLRARHQRDRLAELDAERLADLGLSRDQAAAEAARPIWDVPRNWRL